MLIPATCVFAHFTNSGEEVMLLWKNLTIFEMPKHLDKLKASEALGADGAVYRLVS
jgi:hypothetical protein